MTSQTPQSYTFGSYRLDAEKLLLYLNGTRVSAGLKPLLILSALLEADGEVVKLNDLLDRAWPNQRHLDRSSLSVCIFKLRKIFGDSLTIKNEYGRGYQLIAPGLAAVSGQAAVTPPPTTISSTTRGRFRLVVFGLDGILLRGLDYSWRLVWKHLGYSDRVRRRAMQRYLLGTLSYKEWCDYCCKMFAVKGLHRRDFEAIATPVKLTRNFRQTINRLRRKGIVLALISGGIDVLLYEKIPNANRLFDYIYINRLKFDKDGLLCGVIPTPFDFGGKRDAVLQICKHHGFTLEETALVGEGLNDVDLAAVVGLKIAYSPHSQRMREMADVILTKDDLSLILPHVM